MPAFLEGLWKGDAGDRAPHVAATRCHGDGLPCPPPLPPRGACRDSGGTGRGGAAAPQRRREVPPVRYRAAGPGRGSVSFPSLTPLPALPYNKKLRRQRGAAGGCAGRRSVGWRGGRARAGRAGCTGGAGLVFPPRVGKHGRCLAFVFGVGSGCAGG